MAKKLLKWLEGKAEPVPLSATTNHEPYSRKQQVQYDFAYVKVCNAVGIEAGPAIIGYDFEEKHFDRPIEEIKQIRIKNEQLTKHNEEMMEIVEEQYSAIITLQEEVKALQVNCLKLQIENESLNRQLNLLQERKEKKEIDEPMYETVKPNKPSVRKVCVCHPFFCKK